MAKAPKEDESLEATPPAKRKPALIKFLIIGLAVLIVAGGLGGGAYYYFVIQAAAKKNTAPPPIGTVWPMEPFIINIQDTNSERYLKIVVQLEISDAQGTKELELLKPKLRDNILDLLAAKNYRELVDITGKQRLREEIVLRLNSFLTTTKVTRVYFTEFVVQ
ncbi:MAG: flagellar basal body-associated FliL family protein [Syntrophales bacterium]|nr:flagellar basal body-associated FliL family protein [Syntrophales bacterium]